MTKMLVMESAKKLIFFLHVTASHLTTALALLHYTTLDFARHCATPFGTYIRPMMNQTLPTLRPLKLCTVSIYITLVTIRVNMNYSI